jgi:hypothetical protein
MRLGSSVPTVRSWTAIRAATAALVTVTAGVLVAGTADAAEPEVVHAPADGTPIVLDGEKEIRFRASGGAQLLVDCQTSAGRMWQGALYGPSDPDRRLPSSDGHSDPWCKGSMRHKIYEALVLPEDGEYRLRFYGPAQRATFWLTLADTPAVPVTGDNGYVEVKPAAEGRNAALSFDARAGEHIKIECLPWLADRVVLYGPDRRRLQSTEWSSDEDCQRIDHWDAPPTGTVVDTTMPVDGRYLLIFDYERSWTKATQVWFTRSTPAPRPS